MAVSEVEAAIFFNSRPSTKRQRNPASTKQKGSIKMSHNIHHFDYPADVSKDEVFQEKGDIHDAERNSFCCL